MSTIELPARGAHKVSFVTGDVTEDGGAILLRVQTEKAGPISLTVPTVDLQHLVTLLLTLGGKAALKGRFAASSETFWTRPLPLHGVSIGVDDNQAVITIEVGASVLSFSLTPGCMAEVAQIMLTLTAPEQRN